ncbi:MAG: DUF4276 family protein [Chloroflexota bacterium]|nr:DUF4276 family protein [Chloroflexota bacterium]
MVRLAVVVEGETEGDFVDQVLAPYLLKCDVYSKPTSLRGRISVERLANRIAELFPSFDFVTSLVDFYGFRDKGTRTVDQLEQDIIQGVDGRLRPNWDTRKVIPYVQLHELEGLFFSQVNGFLNVPGANQAAIRQLANIRAQFPSPEEINDNPNTAPSKRILQVLPDYAKRIDGPLVAQSIGLPTIRAQCPRFNSWVTRLESLSA